VNEKILLVDDEADSRALLRDVLEQSEFQVVAIERAEEAVAAAIQHMPDLVLSDVVMPSMSGLALCRKLRGDRLTASTPIVLMSAMRRSELEQAEGIEIGADDYLVKPVAPRLLIARLRAVLKRRPPQAADQDNRLRVGSLKIDLAGRTASVAGKPLALTRKEFDLLAVLVEKKGRVLPAPYLLETVWGYDTGIYKDPHTIEVHVSSLRRKLGRVSRRIVTVPGLGYRFEKSLN
jgi:DNA-binding response OmpR family regulator